MTFCNSNNINSALPLEAKVIGCFYLFHKGSPASSFASTLSEISYFHILNCVTDTTQCFSIKKLVLSIRMKAPSKDTRKPISIGLLHNLVKANESLNQSIYRACSSWENIDLGLQKARMMLEKKQYPPMFYDRKTKLPFWKC